MAYLYFRTGSSRTGGWVLEVAGGALLVVPRYAAIGALVLAGVMAGAVLTHLFLVGGSALLPLALLIVLVAIARARKDVLLRP